MSLMNLVKRNLVTWRRSKVISTLKQKRKYAAAWGPLEVAVRCSVVLRVDAR